MQTNGTQIVAVVVCATALAFAPASASAERVWSLHGQFEVDTGYTDNIHSSPEEPPPEIPPRDDALFTTLSPGVEALSDSPEQSHELRYALETTIVAGASSVESIASRARWRGMFTPTREVRVRTYAEWLHAFLSDRLLPELGGDSVVALPSRFSQLSSLSTQASLSYRLGRDWRLRHYGTLQGFAGFSNGSVAGGVDLGTGAGVERAWRDTAVGALGGIAFSDFARPGETGADNQLVWRGQAYLRRDLARSAVAQLEGGAAGLLGEDTDRKARPIGRLALSYTVLEDGILSASAGRDVRPNLFLAHTVLRDEARLSATIPMPWTRDRVTRKASVAARLRVGAAESRAIDLSTSMPGAGGTSDPWRVYQVSGGVGYEPHEALRFGVRYSYTRQKGNPMIGNLFLPFERNMVMVTVWGRYPRDTDVRTRLNEQRLQRVGDTLGDDDDLDDPSGGSR